MGRYRQLTAKQLEMLKGASTAPVGSGYPVYGQGRWQTASALTRRGLLGVTMARAHITERGRELLRSLEETK